MPTKLSMPSLSHRFGLLLVAIVVATSLHQPAAALASSIAGDPVSAPALAADCSSGSSSAGSSTTSDGVSFTFGSDVSDSQQSTVKDSINAARDYGQRTLGVKVKTMAICAYGTATGVAQAEANWLDEPGVYDSQVASWVNSPGLTGIAIGYQSTTDSVQTNNLGFFALTTRAPWLQPFGSQQTVAHEYFHLIQQQLDDLGQDTGPTWLIEGSAELFGYLAACDRYSIDYDLLRASIRNIVSKYPGSLKNLEEPSVFGSATNVGYAYPLSMLAADALSPNGDMSGFVRYFKDIGAGTPWRDAFAHAFGTSVDAFYVSFTVP